MDVTSHGLLSVACGTDNAGLWEPCIITDDFHALLTFALQWVFTDLTSQSSAERAITAWMTRVAIMYQGAPQKAME